VEDFLFQIDFCEKLLSKNPNFVEALVTLGELYTRRGLYDKGLQIDLRLVELLPQDPICHYNLACSYALLMRPTEAFEALERAITLGYDDFELLEEDSDLKSLRQDPRYKELLGKYFKKYFSQKDSL